MTARQTYVKDPDAVLDYAQDWSEWLGADTLSSASWTVPSGITLGNGSNGAPAPAATATVATAWLLGGVAGTDYAVTCRVVTAGGRTDDRTVTIQVRQR